MIKNVLKDKIKQLEEKESSEIIKNILIVIAISIILALFVGYAISAVIAKLLGVM